MNSKRVLRKYMRKALLFRCMDKIWPGSIKKLSFYGKKELMDRDLCQDYIAQRLLSGVPFMAARFGSVELRCMIEREKIQNDLLLDYSEKTYRSMHHNAGFFPAEGCAFDGFADVMKRSSQEVDLLGVWYNNLENYYIDTYMKEATLTRIGALEPYFFERPWSRALKGKKVLVIHPFVESIQEQYSRRELLFENQDVLPEFQLLCYKAPQTVEGEDISQYQSWFEVLDKMHGDISAMEYDVAILGCGAYGFPLAAMIKKDGKQAIHMGGATQILFGIKGKRWDEHPVISKLYNEYWIRPGKQEQTNKHDQIENGCYW